MPPAGFVRARKGAAAPTGSVDPAAKMDF